MKTKAAWTIALALAGCGDDGVAADGTTGEPTTTGDPTGMDGGPGPDDDGGPTTAVDDSGSTDGGPSTGGDGTDTGEGSSETDPWPTDPDPDAPPDAGWFMYIGGDLEGMGTLGDNACLERWTAAGDPTPVFCPEPDPDGAPRILRATAVRHDAVWLVIERAELDVYPQEIWRIDLTDDTADLMLSYPGDPNGGTSIGVNGLVPLPDGEAALSRHFDPFDGPAYDEVSIVSADGTVGPDLLPGRDDAMVFGQLGSGELVVADGDAEEIVAVPPGGGGETVMSGSLAVNVFASGDFAFVSPDGEAVAFIAGQQVHRATLDADAAMSGQASPFGLLGFATNGDVLARGLRDELLRWDGTDGTVATELAPDATFTVFSGPVHAGGFTALRASSPDGVGAAWIRGTQVQPPCPGAIDMSNVAPIHDNEDAIVIYGDRADEALGTLYSCRPGGPAVDVLGEHGRWGLPLPYRFAF